MRSKTAARITLGATVLILGGALTFAASWLPFVDVAHAGPVSTGGSEVFCVLGTPNNTPWDWAVVDLTGSAAIAESATVGAIAVGTTTTIVTAFVASINAPPIPPTGASAALTSTGACTGSEVEMTVTFPPDFSFQVGPVGGPLEPVGASPVTFNPTIRLVPEPTVASGLLAGIVGVALLGRARARRSA